MKFTADSSAGSWNTFIWASEQPATDWPWHWPPDQQNLLLQIVQEWERNWWRKP